MLIHSIKCDLHNLVLYYMFVQLFYKHIYGKLLKISSVFKKFELFEWYVCITLCISNTNNTLVPYHELLARA